MSLILSLILGGLIIVLVFMVAIHLGFRAPREPNTVLPEAFGLPYEVVKITNGSKHSIHAWWLGVKPVSKNSVVMIHGWGANKSLLLPLAKSFIDAGWNVLMLDAHNHGNSDWRGDSTMPKFSEDLEAAIAWLKASHPHKAEKIVAVGHSVGAAATILSAVKHQTADGYIAIASFAHPKIMMQRYLGLLAKIPLLSHGILNYVQWVIGYQFDEIAPVNNVPFVKAPLLCLHGEKDRLIPVADHALICQNANPNVQCAEIPGADHDSIELIDQHFPIIRDFLNRVKTEIGDEN